MAGTPWADGPVPLIPTPQYLTKKTDVYTTQASVMATVHNAYIRYFNTVYRQARNVLPPDYPAFVGYAEAWAVCVHEHHNSEEAIFFPAVRAQAGDDALMRDNEEQHKAFHGGLERYAAYLAEVRTSPQCRDFDGTRLVAIMDSFKDALMEHLADEIPTLLALERYGDKLDIVGLMEKTGEHSVAEMPKLSALTAFNMNHDVTYEGGIMADFAPIPAPVVLCMRHVFPLWNSAWWKFAACDKYGRPKQLACP